jgi:hypothetical protein
MAKKPGRTWSVELSVVGLNFRWKRDVIAMMPGWVPFPVTLEREPDNRFDSDAIKVVIAGTMKLTKLRGAHFGYISNRLDEEEGQRVGLASLLAPKLDSGAIEPVKLWVTDIDVDSGAATLSARFRDRPTAKRGVKKRSAS